MTDVRSFGVGDFANAGRSSGMLDSEMELRRVDVSLLDPNPYQKRSGGRAGQLADGPAVLQMMKDIQANGQLAPVCVWRHPDDHNRFQLIYGHRRSESFRRLLAAAETPAEKAKWSHISAIVRTDIESPVQLSALCIAENFQREDLTPFEEAESIASHMEIAGLASAKDVARELNIDAKRVTRLLRLNGAPPYIRQALERGLALETTFESPDGAVSKRKEKEKLDLLASVEWIRLHEHLVNQGKKLDAVAAMLTPRMEESVRDRWSFRRVKDYVDGRIAGRKEKPEGSATKQAPAAFTREKDQLTIRLGRLNALDEGAREALRAQLAEVLAALDGAAQAAR